MSHDAVVPADVATGSSAHQTPIARSDSRMIVPSTEFLARKEKAISEDLRTAFSVYESLVRQVGEIRRWLVTVEVAGIGFAFSKVMSEPRIALLPTAVALFAFLILELRARSSMRFVKKEVLDVERILMEIDPHTYTTRVVDYEFRDLRLARFDRAQKLTHLVASAFDLQVVIWYGFWLAVLAAALIAI